MATSPYDYSQYSSYSQDPAFQALQSQFAGAFGGNYPTFSYEAFTKDPNYARNIYDFVGSDPQKAPMRQQALSQLLDFFRTKTQGTPFDQAGGKIDVASLYNPLKAEIGQLGQQQLQAGTAEISRQSQNATTRATEGLAGTGLGRSGVAAGAFQGLEQGRAQAVESLGQEIRGKTAEAQFAVDQRIKDLQFSEDLAQRGADQAFINDALVHQRALDEMQFKNLLDIAQTDAAQNWWTQYVDPILGTAGQIAGKKL